MKKTLLFLSLSLIVFAGCNSTQEKQNNVEKNSQEITASSAPQKITTQQTTSTDATSTTVSSKSSTVLTIQGPISYIDDQGMIIHTLGETDFLTHALQGKASTETIEVKQADLHIDGASMIWKDMANIKEHLIPIRTSIEVVGNDLHITPDFRDTVAEPKSNHANSYIMFNTTLPSSYRLEIVGNWYNSALFVVPQKQWTLLNLKRSSDYETISFSHKDNELDYESFEYRNSESKAISITKNKTIDINIQDPRHTEEKKPVALFHLTLEDGTTGNEKCLKTINTQDANLYHLQAYLQRQNLKISSCKEINTKPKEDGLVGAFITDNDYRQAVVTMQGGSILITPFTHNIFEPSITAIYPSNDDRGPLYQIKIETLFALQRDDIQEQCLQIRSGCEISTRNKTLNIQPIPGVSYDETLSLTNVFGQTSKANITYQIDQIDPRATLQQIISNDSINVLPSNGDFSDILIEYRNVENFSLSLQACTVGETFVTDQGYIGKAVENYFFDCQGEIKDITVRPMLKPDEGFNYRQTYRTAIELPDDFKQNTSFKLFFTDKKGNKQSHFVTLSDIAIRTKKSDDTISLRSMYYQDGQSIEGTYAIYTAGGEKIKEGAIDTSKTTITLPQETIEYSDRRRRLLLLTVKDSDGNTARTALDRNGSSGISVNGTSLGKYRSLHIDSNLSPSEIVSSDSNMSFWGTIPPWSLYGYAARGIYKPGETVEVAGFLRNMRPLANNSFTNTSILVTLYPPTESMERQKITLTVDEFGGFEGKFILPEDAPLGFYDLEYEIDKYSYSHNIAVEEYTKPTFSIGGSIQQSEKQTTATIIPTYFFGTGLSSYDLDVEWSLAEEESCFYCWWSESPDSYTNTVLGSMESIYGDIKLTDQSYQSEITLLTQETLDKVLPGTQLKIMATIKDNITNEVQHRTRYEDIGADAIINLEGRTRDWLYRDGSLNDPRNETSIKGSLEAKSSPIDSLVYDVYYGSYERGTQKGVDGNIYYVSDSPYEKIFSKELSPNDGEFTIPVEFLDEPGSYVISVKGYNGDKLVVQNDKMLYRYYRKNKSDLLGTVPNNYTLTVVSDQDNYKAGDQASLDIMPYPRGAKAIVTVEQGQYILDSYEITLDGDPITVPLYDHYTPQVSLSVMALQPTNLSTGARQEPRFFAGYAQVGVSTEHKELTIDLNTDKTVYQPGDEVTLTIKTTDHLGQLVDARVSVAVVDKALTYLYERSKDPLSHFFRKVGSSIATYTNMKLLYQSLKVFATDGSKGGGGVGGETMFTYIRDELLDQAYRNPSIKTKNGSAQVSFTLPDNMTTWLVDVVGITKDTKLGTTSHEFMTQQEVIVEGYMPRFMTLGDSIDVPYKIILADASAHEEISGRVWITNANDTDTHEIVTYKEATTNTKIATITIPDAWRETPFIKVHHEVIYGDGSDHIVQTIPLRTAGLIYRQGESNINEKGNTSFTLPEYRTATLKIEGSTLPTQIILPSIQSTLRDDNFYHSTPSISQLQALVHLKQREEVSASYPTRYQNNEVFIDDQRYNIDQRIASLVNTISNYQRDGGAIVPHTRRYKIDSSSTYHNSYQAYQALLSLQDSGYMSESQIDKIYLMTQDVAAYLGRYRDLSPELRNLVLVTQIQHNISTNDTSSLTVEQSGYKGVLDYLRTTHDTNRETTKRVRDLAVVPTNRALRAYGHGDVSLSTALLIQAMMKDNTHTISDVTPQLQSLFALSNKNNGCRSCAPLVQSRVRQTIIDSRSYLKPVSQTTCEITSSKGSETIKITKDNAFQLDLPLTTSEATFSRSCENPLVWDVVAHYMPTTISSANNIQSENLTHMKQEIILEKNMANIVTSFATNLAGENTIVAVHLPSTMTHVAKDLLTQEILFSDYHCRPDHMEQRYDKLIMYYDVLEPGTCDFSFPAMATFAGEVNVMPLQIYEANKGLIRGTRTIGE